LCRAELGLQQAHVILGLAKLGILAALDDVGEAALRGRRVACAQGQLTQMAQAGDAIRRQLAGALQGGAGFLRARGLFAQAGEEFVGLDEAIMAGEQLGQDVFGFDPGFLHHQHAREAERGPGDGACGKDLAIQRLGLGDLADAGVQLRPAGA
jgi:hypothetical protein